MSLLLCRFLGIPLTPDFGSHPSDASFSQYLLAVAGEMRLQMHTTWLILGAFGTLGLAGLMWVGAEKMQQKSEWSRQDVTWMLAFAAALFLSAIFYRAATQGALSRKFALSGGIADMFAISVAVAVPIVLWYRWHKPPQEAKPREKDEEESFSTSHYSRTILGLHDYSPPPPEKRAEANRIPEVKETPAAAAPALMQPPPATQPSQVVATMADKQPEPAKEQIPAIEPIPAKAQLTEPIKTEAIGMENMTILNLDAQPQTTQPTVTPTPTPASQSATAQPAAAPEPVMAQQFTPQPGPMPMAAPQPISTPSWMAQPPAPERSAVPSAGFREQLIALNLSWQRIEESGKELEDWFQRQHRRVFAHLERPSARSQDTHMEVSRDFLEQRMDRVDAEWAAIHRTVRDMYRWLENGNTSVERTEVSQEPKVW